MNRKSKLYIIVLLVAVFTIGSSILCAGYSASPVIVTQNNIKKNTEAIDINLKVPIVHEVTDLSVEKKINDIFYSDAINFAVPLEKDAEKYLGDTKKNPDLHFNKYSAYTTYNVKYNKNNLLSIPVRYAQYTGGANGLEVQRGYTFDLTTGKQLKLSDLFEKGFDYRTVISSEILKQIKAEPDKYFPDTIKNFKKIPSNQAYYIDNGNLVIFYGPFEIAPHVVGIPEFKIPFKDLKFNKSLNIN